MNSPFTLYCSPGEHDFDEEHSFGTVIVEEDDVEEYMATGKWFLNSGDAVDAYINELERAELEQLTAGAAGTESITAVTPNDAPEPEAPGIPDWTTDEEIEQVKANDNEAGTDKRSTRRTGNKSSNV